MMNGDVVASGIQNMNEEHIMEKMKDLEAKYIRTEYNCHKKHHNNPGTINKLKSLLAGEGLKEPTKSERY